VRASRQVRFKEVGEVMNLVRQAGFKDVVFGAIAE
jgi:biopolymer transport protein ExbD